MPLDQYNIYKNIHDDKKKAHVHHISRSDANDKNYYIPRVLFSCFKLLGSNPKKANPVDEIQRKF